MYFLFSGEGPTDLGQCHSGTYECDGEAFDHGPMTIIVDQIVEAKHGYSFLDGEHFGFVSKHTLVAGADELKANRKSMRLPGKKQSRETGYFYNNARVLARIAIQRQHDLDDDVVAVLFRDSDGTASAGRGLWEDKRQSMIDGFDEEGFDRGVPMIPKPKSEAWIICAVKPNPYQSCDALEDRSRNDNSPNSLKQELGKILGERASKDTLNAMVSSRSIDFKRIKMPSFKSFRKRLEEVI